jgi:hypothetical protein
MAIENTDTAALGMLEQPFELRQRIKTLRRLVVDALTGEVNDAHPSAVEYRLSVALEAARQEADETERKLAHARDSHDAMFRGREWAEAELAGLREERDGYHQSNCELTALGIDREVVIDRLREERDEWVRKYGDLAKEFARLREERDAWEIEAKENAGWAQSYVESQAELDRVSIQDTAVAELRDGDHLEYLSPNECAVILQEREADAVLSMLEQAHNAGMTPGIGLRVEDVRAAGFKLVSERFREQDPYIRGLRIVATVARRPS